MKSGAVSCYFEKVYTKDSRQDVTIITLVLLSVLPIPALERSPTESTTIFGLSPADGVVVLESRGLFGAFVRHRRCMISHPDGYTLRHLFDKPVSYVSRDCQEAFAAGDEILQTFTMPCPKTT